MNFMKKLISLFVVYFLPLANVLAHNGVDDGHSVAVPPSADERITVAIGLGIAVLLAGLIMWWIRRKK